MRALVAMAFAAVLAGGCDSLEWNERSTRESLAILPEVRYFRDPRIGLCFAYFYQERNRGANSATGGPALASVPCAAVQGLLVNPPAKEGKDG